MTIWQPELSQQGGPRYLAIAETLARDIEARRLQEGTRLPTHRELAEYLGVTVGTVTRAYAEAARRGLIHSTVGRGTFVRTQGEGAGPFGIYHAEPGLIDLSVNRPSLDYQSKALARTLISVARQPNLEPLANYQSEVGLMPHRQAAVTWVQRRGLDADAESIIVTSGAQHGLHATLSALTKPGEVILTEALTYPGIKSIAGTLGLRVQGVEMDEQGIIPEALDATCRGTAARVLVCMPTTQNPTTAILPEDRRRQVVEIARAHSLSIVEDDVYSFLIPEAPLPLAAMAPERTYYVTSISKSMAPGLRIGYVVAPERRVASVAAMVRTTVWMACPLMAEVAALWIRDGTGTRLADSQRQEAHVRQAIASRLLGPWPVQTHPDSMHLWLYLPVPWRASDFAAEARTRGVAVVPTEIFAVVRGAPEAVRICLSAVSSHAR
ncbi:MAG: PLP-dependent aminotransferase family protein, partial [Acidiferrobacterales bacterium]